MEVWQNEDKNFKDLLLASEKVREYLSPEEIESLFDVNHYLRHVKTIFNRVFGHETT